MPRQTATSYDHDSFHLELSRGSNLSVRAPWWLSATVTPEEESDGWGYFNRDGEMEVYINREREARVLARHPEIVPRRPRARAAALDLREHRRARRSIALDALIDNLRGMPDEMDVLLERAQRYELGLLP